MSNGSFILAPDGNMSAQQRDIQRQQMAHDIGVLARNLNTLRAGMIDYSKATDARLDQSQGAIIVNEKHIFELNQKLHDFQTMTFWQRLSWLVRGQ